MFTQHPYLRNKNYMTDFKYIEQVFEGCSLQFGQRMYRVHNDKGWLFIFPTVEGKRKKIGIDKLGCWWEYGSPEDWAINGWYNLYPDYQVFKSFADNEKLAA
jgi:hypothetical protein